MDKIETMEIDSTGLIQWIFTEGDSAKGYHLVDIYAVNSAGSVMQSYSLFVRGVKLYDVNGDGVIDIKDVQKIAAQNGVMNIDEDFNPDFDYNEDGILDSEDVKLLILELKKME